MAEDLTDQDLIKVVHNQVEDKGEYWLVHTTKTYTDGVSRPSCHAFPKDTLEWRAAEYGLDPADVETLLDIVLVETYLLPEEWAVGVRLADALTVAEARDAHLSRIAKAKLRLRISTRTKADPEVRSFLAVKLGVNENKANELDFIRTLSDMDTSIVAIKSRMVRRNVEGHHSLVRMRKPGRTEKFRKAEEEMNRG